MITFNEAYETIRMISEANLDVRTITMGINLMDCADSDYKAFCGKIYDKVTRKAEHLAEVGDDIAREYGVPVINKRISVTPIAIAASGCRCGDFVDVARALDHAAQITGINFIGGFSALIHKGITQEDQKLLDSIPTALSETERVCSSISVASTRSGINIDAVNSAARVVKDTAAMTSERDSIGCAKFVVFCNAVEDNPFMAGAFHGLGEADTAINVGVSGPGVVKCAVESVKGADFETLCETVKRTAFKITRVGQLVAQEASRRLGVPFGVIDLSLAPTPAIGDSVAEILQEMGLEQPGAPGTIAAIAILNDNVKKGGVMASSYVGGLSGAFIPVSEDHGMIEAVRLGALTFEKLEAMTCVCSVGIDMVAIPGDTPADTISGLILDEMAIGMINGKTTAVRIIPVVGKKAGETATFGGLLGEAPVMEVNRFGCSDFVRRGGRIPSPIQSFRN